MIYSAQRQYLFIHIPKTGGTSMAVALESRAAKNDVLVGDTPKAKRRTRRLKNIQTAGRLWKHSTLRDLDGMIPPDDLAKLFVFTMVRNPWDRIVSYYHWLQTQTFDHPVVELAQNRDFSEFLKTPLIQASIKNHPYTSYVQDGNGAERCDLFIRLEHLTDDLTGLNRHLGFELYLPRINTSQRKKDYRSYYSEADRELIAQLCEEDIARFGYRFEG